MIVLDCSAAINITQQTDEGNALLMLMAPQEEVFAPTLFQSEVTNAYWKFARFGGMPIEMARTRMQWALNLVTDYRPIDDLCVEALSEGLRFNHSTYDMFYLVLARRTGATLFTLDAKLMELAEQCGVEHVQPIDWEE